MSCAACCRHTLGKRDDTWGRINPSGHAAKISRAGRSASQKPPQRCWTEGQRRDSLGGPRASVGRGLHQAWQENLKLTKRSLWQSSEVPGQVTLNSRMWRAPSRHNNRLYSILRRRRPAWPFRYRRSTRAHRLAQRGIVQAHRPRVTRPRPDRIFLREFERTS